MIAAVDFQIAKTGDKRFDGLDAFGTARRGCDRTVRLVKEREAEFFFKIVQQARDLGQIKLKDERGAGGEARAGGSDERLPRFEVVDGFHRGFEIGLITKLETVVLVKRPILAERNSGQFSKNSV